MKNSKLNIFASFATLLSFATSLNASAAVGRTAGSYGVSNSGTASYSIPIWTPPGTGGMAANVSLDYNSASGDGVVGVGWSISGLPAITRCPKTWAQDGTRRDQRNDLGDAFCMNGNRLRLVAGSYGTDGAEYRTEIETFSRVRSYGAAGEGPAYFVVESKNGLIYEYGNTTDSRVESVGQQTARMWALNQVRDRNGNTVLYSYIEDATYGEFYIDKIRYTQNTTASLAPHYQVEFVYEGLPTGDVDSGYAAGFEVSRVKRLDRIDVTHDSLLVHRYELTYEAVLSTTTKSRLANVQECAGSTPDCLLPTTFTYQNGTIGVGSESNTGVPVIGSSRVFQMDVNGDAFFDMVYPSSATSGSGTWRVAFANASGNFAAPIDTGISNSNWSGAVIADYNADGLDDLLVPYSGNTWWVMLGTAGGLANPFDTGIPVTTTGSGANARSLDIDGDGLQDLVWADLVGMSGGDAIRYRLRELAGTYSSTVYTFVGPFSEDAMISNVFGPVNQRATRRAPDFDGDGRADVVFQLTVRSYVDPIGYKYIRSMRAVCAGGLSFTAPLTVPSSIPDFADFNGDGLTDLFYVYGAGSNSLVAQFSTGKSFSPPVSILSLNGYDSFVAMDWDGDGAEDILIRNTSTGGVDFIRSTEVAFTPPSSTGIVIPSAGQMMVTDANGDGLADLLFPNGGVWVSRLHSGIQPDLMTNVTDGFGLSTTFNYVSASRSNYVKESGAIFPSVDYQGPMTVVGSVISSTGIGNGSTYTQTFVYYGGRIDLQGRGFLGFRAKQVQDSRNGLYVVESYCRDFPCAGVLEHLDVIQSNGTTPISKATTVVKSQVLDTTPYNQRYFLYAESATQLQYEFGGTLNGQLISTTATTYGYDAYGNVTNTTSTAIDNDATSPYYGQSWARTTTTPISLDPTYWCLTLPSSLTVTRDAPDTPTLIRTKTFVPDSDPVKCRIKQQISSPNDTIYQVTELLGFDVFGNVSSIQTTGIGLPTRTLSTDWGARGQFPMSVTNALGHSTTYGYDFSTGVQTTILDPNGILNPATGVTTKIDYDSFGRLYKETRADGTYSQTNYTDCINTSGCLLGDHGMRLVQTNYQSNGSVLNDGESHFDIFDRPLLDVKRNYSGGYDRNEVRYDSLGRVQSKAMPCAWVNVSTACAYWATLTYDDVGRLKTESRPINVGNLALQTSSITYQGRTTIVTDPQGKLSTKISTVIGQLGRSADHDGYYQTFKYDAFGSLKSVIDSLSNTLQQSTYDYGVRAFQRTKTDMDTGTWTYTYNALGEVTDSTDANGASFTYTYDALSRPRTQTNSTEGTTIWTWGNSAANKNIGQLESLGSTNGPTEDYFYDSLGRPEHKNITIEGIQYSFHNTYHSTTGLLETITYPVSTSGYRVKVRYAYNNGVLYQVKDDNTNATLWQAMAFNSRGQVTQEAIGSSLITNRNYDPVTGWISSIQCGSGGGACIQNQSYLWDKMGNMTQRQNNNLGLTENFYYDNVYRLDYSQLNGTTNLDLSYSPMGNILSRTDVASGAAWTYDTNRKHQVTQAGNASFTYAYDANGNVTSRNGYSITWNKYNYPTLINGNGESAAFSYDGNMSRWKQVYTKGATTETTLYIGHKLEKASNGGVDDYRHYIYVGDTAVAIISRMSNGANATRLLLRDALGSVSRIMDASGSNVVSESFTAYGVRRNPATWTGVPTNGDLVGSVGVTREGYTGQDGIGSMGLNHMNGRVQDAITGRFLSADPFVNDELSTQSFNRYSYVSNNPMTLVDPSGFTQERDRPHLSWINHDLNTQKSPYEVIVERQRERLITTLDWGLTRMNPEITSPEMSGGGGGGNDADIEPVVVEGNKDPKPEKPCEGIAGTIQGFTGGASDQSFVDDVVDNYVDTTNFGVDNVIDNYAGTNLANTSGVPNPGLRTAAAVAGAGKAARSWGGVTPGQAIGQVWNASRSAIRTPGLILFRTPASLVATSSVTWAVGAIAVRGAYSTGVLIGSILRTAVNRAATAACKK